jgi:hypothetical protein
MTLADYARSMPTRSSSPAALLRRADMERLARCAKAGQPFKTRVTPSALRVMRDELFDFDLTRVVEAFPESIDARLTPPSGPYHYVRRVAPHDAAALYDVGHTLFIEGARGPALNRWCSEIAALVWHPRPPQFVSLFATKKGACTRAHFDQFDNVTVQLRGTKRWRVAANRHVASPTLNGTTFAPARPQMELQLEANLPVAMPEPYTSFELREGDLLYTPRGYWHDVEAQDDALSLLIGLGSSPWLDMVTEVVRAHLTRLPAWRENVVGQWEDSEARARAREQLAELLARLPQDLAAITVDQVIPDPSARALAGESDAYERNPIATLDLSEAAAGTTVLKVVVHRGEFGEAQAFEVGARMIPLCRWLNRQNGVITIAAMARELPAIPRDALRAFVGALVEGGFLLEEKRPGAPRKRR